jgi:membrane dipeptidase
MSSNNFPLVFDGHNDTILDAGRANGDLRRSFFERSGSGHIDLPRAREGGLGGGFFAVFVPSPKRSDPRAAMKDNPDGYHIPLPAPLEHAYALDFAMGATAELLRWEAESEGQVRIVRTAAELSAALEQKILAILLHFEGAEAIDTDLGLRSIGITWSRPNAFGHGVPFAYPADPDIGPGLTEAGKRLVTACNQLGVVVDLSHLNEKGFWDVASLSQAPLVATHSGAHALCPSPRNLTDRQLDAVRDSDGVVGVNFHIGFLRSDGRSDVETSVTEIVRHVDYMVRRMGIDHVALGSDFDGAVMPHDLADVAGLPRLMTALQDAGYAGEELRKLAHANWERLLKSTWKS